MSPETQVDLLLKFWNTHPYEAKVYVYFLDELDQELNYEPVSLRVENCGPNYLETISNLIVSVRDRDQVLINMRKIVIEYRVTNDPANLLPVLKENYLKGQVKMRLLNGITVDIKDLIDTINNMNNNQ
jgi:hypothetical protein